MSKLGKKVRLSMYDMVKNLHASFFHPSIAKGNIQVQIYHHLNQALLCQEAQLFLTAELSDFHLALSLVNLIF